jgi:hypothetical protein
MNIFELTICFDPLLLNSEVPLLKTLRLDLLP